MLLEIRHLRFSLSKENAFLSADFSWWFHCRRHLLIVFTAWVLSCNERWCSRCEFYYISRMGKAVRERGATSHDEREKILLTYDAFRAHLTLAVLELFHVNNKIVTLFRRVRQGRHNSVTLLFSGRGKSPSTRRFWCVEAKRSSATRYVRLLQDTNLRLSVVVLYW